MKNKTKKNLKVLVAQSVQLFQMRVVHQAPLATEFSRQEEYWSGYHSLLQGSSQPRDQTRGPLITSIFFIV